MRATRLASVLSWLVLFVAASPGDQAPPPRPKPDPLSPIPSVGRAGPITLRKGERVRIEQSVYWNQFKSDVLTITFSVSDPDSLADRPIERCLWFDRNPGVFDYEIRAGDKAGEFVLTVTPETGTGVLVRVVVK